MYTWLTLNSSADLAQLERVIGAEYSPKIVAQRLVDGLSNAVKAVMVEFNYIDKDYRSTYYNFYAKKGQHYRADCVRLHFFDALVTYDPKSLRLSCPDNRLEDHYFGYMVLRPTGIATIGRSILSADVRNGARGFIITARHKVHLLGYKLWIEGFPSMDQHVDIAVCAHAVCWSVLRHYSERYSVYSEHLTHDITMMAQEFNPGGLVPSRGLYDSDAERILQEAGTFPIRVARNLNQPDDPEFYRQLISYVESGFPLFAAMEKRGHAIAIIGHEWRKSRASGPQRLKYAWDQVDSLVVVDDNQLPYLTIPVSGGTEYSAQDIDVFIVPLPEKVFYPATAIDQLTPILFKLGKVIDLPKEEETIIRYFITTGASLRSFVRERESEFDPKLIQLIMSIPFAQFVWVVEFATEPEWAVGQISARAVIDATASYFEQWPFWLFHSRKKALVFNRKSVVLDSATGMGALVLADTGHTAFTRMDRNLRPIKGKQVP
ncbi:MAG TPA: hypothetical protein VMX38_11380 [Verrucomicrobiae bacterium]|nr:hypothetical protein [Verrucomicrobiae bacterium]